MGLYLLFGVLLLFLAVLAARSYVQASPAHLAQGVRAFIAAFSALASTGLLFSGRLGLAAITVGATFMALRAMSRARGTVGGFGGQSAGQATSEVETDTLRMRLDHRTGELEGEVRRGQLAGRSLELAGAVRPARPLGRLSARGPALGRAPRDLSGSPRAGLARRGRDRRRRRRRAEWAKEGPDGHG